MNDTFDSASAQEALQIDTFPDGLVAGSTVLLAGDVDPVTYAVGLRALCHYGHSDESALVVTTTESANQTLTSYNTVCSDSDRPFLSFADTASTHQYINNVYGEPPTVQIPSPGDLERLMVALSDLAQNSSAQNNTRHLLVRSLTPLLESAPSTRVWAVLEQITGLQTETGLSFLGVDAAAHSEKTMIELTDRVDGVLWITRTSGNHIKFELRARSGHHRRSLLEGDKES